MPIRFGRDTPAVGGPSQTSEPSDDGGSGRTPTGDLIGVTSDGAIIRYRDSNDDGSFSGNEIKTIARTGGKNGNNAAFDADEGYLYAGTPAGVRRFRYSSRLDDLGAGEDVVVGQPSTGTHSLHTVKVFDGYLYVHSGSVQNAAEPAEPDYDTERSVLKRFRLEDGVINGLDDLVYQGEDVHLDNPGDDVVHVEQGKAHGYPSERCEHVG